MAKTYRAAIVGAPHMHVLYLAQDCLDNPQIDLRGIADTPPLMDEWPGEVPFTRNWNLEFVTRRLGVPRFDDYKRMLDREQPEFVLVATETALHPEIFAECARRGIAVAMEKPMALNLSEGLKMARTARQTGATLMVNWPIAWQPFMTQYSEQLRAGAIGKLLKVRQLVGHPGPLGRGVRHPRVAETSDATTGEEKAGTWWYNPELGGGAMMDFCCYGAMCCNWLIGARATAVSGLRCNTDSPFAAADDNAAMLVRYPEVLAVLEGSWTAPVGAVLPGPELFGSEGKMWCEETEAGVVVKLLDFQGKTTTLPPLEPAPHMRNITTAFTHHRDTGEALPIFLQLEQNLDVLAILDAGVRSASSGRLEPVANAHWQIG